MGSLIYAASWLVFAVSHSMLARQSVQRRVERLLGRYYRLVYNLVSVLQLSVVFLIGGVWLDGAPFVLFDNDGLSFIAMAVKYLGMAVLMVAVIAYDVGRFAGITQISTGERVSSSNSEPLQQRFLNKWMRHPLYTGAFLILWGGATSAFGAWTAVWGTLYLLIGTAFEERKLIRIHGDEYRAYQRQVPRYFPVPIARK